MKRSSVFLFCVGALALVVATAIYIHHVNVPILDPAGPVAGAEKDVIVTTFLLCCLVIVPVFGMLAVFAWRYREGSSAARYEYHSEWDHYNWIAEIIWWLIPSIIIVLLAILAWKSSYALDPYKPVQGNEPSITINVIALDWKWLFIYPEQGIASVNLVEFPVGAPVHFYLTADAPMNSFWIPQLAGQIMAMPGMTTQLDLSANRPGDFNGFSGNISGDGFAGMAFTARAVPEDEFKQWVAGVKASSTPLTQSIYAKLAKPSEYNPVAFYAPASDVFDATMMKYMTPGTAMYGSMEESMEGASASSTI